MVQIFGCQSDPHVNAVAEKLRREGHAYRILDIFDPASNGISEAITPKLEVSLASDPKDSWQPNVVWWRIKPPYLLATKNIVDYYDQQFSIREWLAALDYFTLMYKDCTWVNSRTSGTSASNKIGQLEIASRLGFSVPRTLFTNNVTKARNFMLSLNGRACVHKTITPYISPNGKVKYTSFIDRSILDTLAQEVKCCPSIFQEYIKPQYELRVTVIGKQLYAAKIKKKNSAEPDWRDEIWEDIYSPFELSEKLKNGILNLQRVLDLHIAAYDFIVDERGDVFFLEVNPSGQWLWIEEKLDLPISDSLALYLIELSSNMDTV